MAKMTLLEMVQDILNDMDGDEVNSISDTTESMQVAQIIKTTFFELMSGRDWPHLATLSQLTASGDSNKPTHMSISNDVQSVDMIKYDKIKDGETKKNYLEVTYLEPAKFMKIINSRDSTASDVTTVTDDSNVELLIINDSPPIYYTSFDDQNLIFDSYDSVVDTTLATSKTQVFGYKEPIWSHTDTATPDLPSKNFPQFLAESKSVCFNSLKQAANQKEEQKAQRQSRWNARKKWRINGGIKYPNYGRIK